VPDASDREMKQQLALTQDITRGTRRAAVELMIVFAVSLSFAVVTPVRKHRLSG